MSIVVKKIESTYLSDTMRIWNEVIDEGVAFPQLNRLNKTEADAFFHEQTYTGVAVDTERDAVVGLYILHPNNVGRCGHIANASYAVDSKERGLHIGEKLVLDCLERAKDNGFKIMQFNAVVDNNFHARHLYERLGFADLGIIPGGFQMNDGHYEDIHIMYKTL